jgi:hypothetical protein
MNAPKHLRETRAEAFPSCRDVWNSGSEYCVVSKSWRLAAIQS